MQKERKGRKVVRVGEGQAKISTESFNELDKCTAIIGRYGCDKTGYPYKTRINNGAIAEYAIHKYLKELEKRTVGEYT